MEEESSSAAENCADTDTAFLSVLHDDRPDKQDEPLHTGGDGRRGRAAWGGGFELQRKLPDGSYRRADESETAAANFQAKMKQAAEMTASLEPGERIEWAGWQRKQGNDLFARGEYREAMDVYLTCLVAMDQKTKKNENADPDVSEDNSTEQQLAGDDMTARIEKEIKLPVLLN
ncbi:hypothetical protein THAOC_25173, partial [Thalassiosira oceanica]